MHMLHEGHTLWPEGLHTERLLTQGVLVILGKHCGILICARI